MAEENVQVAVRVRPSDSFDNKWKAENGAVVRVDDPNSAFHFDQVHDMLTDNERLYTESVSPLVDAAIRGYHTAVCCYGQSGAGKTHTLTGNEEEDGIVHQLFHDLFNRIAEDKHRKFMIHISYLEIYNEVVRDLFEGGNDLKVYEGPNGEPHVRDLSQKTVTNVTDVTKLLEKAQAFRQVGATNLNERSSRSHTILKAVLEANDVGIKSRCSIINLVDLAGSENANAAGANGKRQKEGANINKSLHSLTRVIAQLSEKRKTGQHIPYRDSNLTRILKPSLGGNSKTLVICCIRPDMDTESHSTLMFARQVKNVKACPQVNVVTEDGQLSKCLAEIELLRKQLEERTASETLEKERDEKQNRMEQLLRSIIQQDSGTGQAKRMNNRRMTWAGGRNLVQSRRSFSPPIGRRGADLPTVAEDETEAPSMPTHLVIPPFAPRVSYTASDRRTSGSTASGGGESSKVDWDSFVSGSRDESSEELLEKVTQLHAEKDAAENQLSQCRLEFDAALSELSSLKESNADLKSALENAKSEKSHFEASLQMARSDLLLAREEFSQQKVSNEDLCEQLRQAEKTIQQEKCKSEEAASLVASLRLELDDEKVRSVEANERMKEAMEKTQFELASLAKQKEIADTKLMTKEAEMDQMKKDGLQMIESLREEICRLKAGTVAELEVKLAERTAEKGNLEAQLKNLRAELVAEFKGKFAEKMRSDAETIGHLQKQKRDLEDRIQFMLDQSRVVESQPNATLVDSGRIVELEQQLAEERKQKELLRVSAERVPLLEHEVKYLGKEVNHWKHEHRLSREAQTSLAHRYNSVTKDHKEAVESAEKAEQLQKETASRLRRVEAELTGKEGEISTLSKKLQQNAASLKEQKELAAQQIEQSKSLASQLYMHKTIRSDLEAQLKGRDAEEQRRILELTNKYEEQLGSVREDVARLEKELSQSQSDLFAAQAAVEQYKKHAMNSLKKVQQMEEATRLTGSVQPNENTVDRLTSQIGDLTANLEELKKKESETSSKVKELLAEKERGLAYVKTLKEERDFFKKKAGSSRSPLSNMENGV